MSTSASPLIKRNLLSAGIFGFAVVQVLFFLSWRLLASSNAIEVMVHLLGMIAMILACECECSVNDPEWCGQQTPADGEIVGTIIGPDSKALELPSPASGCNISLVAKARRLTTNNTFSTVGLEAVSISANHVVTKQGLFALPLAASAANDYLKLNASDWKGSEDSVAKLALAMVGNCTIDANEAPNHRTGFRYELHDVQRIVDGVPRWRDGGLKSVRRSGMSKLALLLRRILRGGTLQEAALGQQRIMFRDQFEIRERLHATLFGEIWVCSDQLNNNQLVAVKQVHLNLARQALTYNLVLDNPWNEARTIDTLLALGPHENILQLHQHFEENDSWFVVMEFCEGGDIWQQLERLPHHRLPETQVMPLFKQIARGVHLLHTNGIAHRDLSLENVLLSDNGNADGGCLGAFGVAKICDFGLSTNADCVCRDRVGKAYYMAPEVVAGVAYDARAADVWSLGIILFVMLTGSPPMPLASKHENAFMALMESGVGYIIESWHMNRLVSLTTRHLLDGMLQVNPTNRFKIGDIMALTAP